MEDPTQRETGLPHFRRALALLRPHLRPLLIGLLAALGVGVFYTFSISSVVPLLKVIFAEHETLADWLHRVETERRLDVAIAADVPDDPGGLRIDRVRDDSRSYELLNDGDRIVAVAGEPLNAFEVLRRIAEHRHKRFGPVTVEDYSGATREVELRLRAYHWWSQALVRAAAILPKGKDPDSRLTTLAIVMLALVLVTLASGLFRFINEGLVATAVQRAMHDLRSRLAEHVLRLPVDWHSRQPPGDTLGRFATDIGKVEVGLSTLFGKVIREPLKAIGVIALVAMIDWRLLVVALLGLPIGAVVMRVFGRLVKRAQRRASRSWGRLLDHLGEKLAGIRIVKAYNMQESESRRFDDEGRTLTRAQTHIELVDAATNPALESLAVLGAAAFVLYGGSRVFSGQLEPHLFFAAVVCLGGVFDPVRKMGNVYNRLQQADVSARRLFELLDLRMEETPAAPRGAIELPRFERQIEFRDVSFAYPSQPERLVLDGVCLTVPRGCVVALVGPNGSGKTTLISLLLRFYEPTRGRILIDGRDIAHVTLDSLRAQIGLVTQDSVVFSDTVRDNIAYGANGVAIETVRWAARLAHVEEFIETLRVEEGGRVWSGYETPVTARSLSGGQRQRIALARAILRDPPILVLDEATSQVDSESERKIQEALEDVTRGRTTFIIAHRFSTIARADLIVVLNEGRIVGLGAHRELMSTCPFYVALCETQFARAAS
jgi:subfamily B ATP-binding cassette protein MsbA